ncbi:MAG: hypothetical protein WAV18_28535 [Roseiarcus sp.]
MASEADRHPRHHTQKMQKRLQEIIDHLRADVGKVDEPQLEGDVRDLGRGSVGPEEGLQRPRAEEGERLGQISAGRGRAIMQDRINVKRRKFLETAGYAGLALTSSMLVPPRLGLIGAKAQTPPSQADHTIRIAPVSLKIAPGRIIRTTG